MNKNQFEILLPKYISHVLVILVNNIGCDENKMIFEFMKSRTYQLLIDEKSKLWQLSSYAISDMYLNEKSLMLEKINTVIENDRLTFKVFCIETFKNSYNLSTVDIIHIFENYDVFKYIDSYFEELHSYGDKFIVEDLTLYLNARGCFI